MAAGTFDPLPPGSRVKGKFSKRVDRCLLSLMKYNRNKGLDFVIKKVNWSLSKSLKIIRQLHKTSLNLNPYLVKKTNENVWKLVLLETVKYNYKLILNCNFVFSYAMDWSWRLYLVICFVAIVSKNYFTVCYCYAIGTSQFSTS